MQSSSDLHVVDKPMGLKFGTILDQKWSRKRYGSGTRSSFTSSGSIFWRFDGGEKPGRSGYAAETTFFRSFDVPRRAKRIFYGVRGSLYDVYIW